MKKVVLLIVVLNCARVSAQNLAIDSLKQALQHERSDTQVVRLLSKMADLYAQNKPDSELIVAQQALQKSRSAKYLMGELWSLKQIAEAYQFMGNYPIALHYYLLRLQLDEQNPDPERETVTALSIANLYQLEGDYQQALVYLQKALRLIDKNKLENYRWYSYLSFANLYEKLNNVPEAVKYSQQSLQLAKAAGNEAWLGMSLNNMGNAYKKANEYDKALAFYRESITYLAAQNNETFLCESFLGLSTVLHHFDKIDSAIAYAEKALQLSVSGNLNNNYIEACQYLANYYKEKGQADSALVYLDKMMKMQETIYSREKVKQVENLTLSEQIRQKERLEEKLREETDRKYKLNMLFIGLMIPLFFLLSVFLSQRKIKPRYIEFSGILSLLLVFEYLTLLLHPIIGDITHHSPFLEIIILVVIAAILTPTHHRLEHWLLHTLTHKKQVTIPEEVVIASEEETPPVA